MGWTWSLVALLALISFVGARPYSNDSTVNIINSQIQPGVSITYKRSHICETTPGVKSYTGYVHLPASVLGDVPADYNISTFFWFFEARNNRDTAPLAIYLAGGPGTSSTQSILDSESGPCFVNPDGNGTTLNPWSFNDRVNMLYIDQPVQTGLSYDSLIKATYDVLTNVITPLNAYETVPESNATFGVGTYASQNPLHTTNNTVASAKALWHFAENWLTQFPEYKPKNKKISIWGNSYGGFWVPATAALFDREIKKADNKCSLKGFKIDTVGITNGCIDLYEQGQSYLDFAINNTYNFPLIDEATYQEALFNFSGPGGCQDQLLQCRQLGEEGDPNWTGANATINEACIAATLTCVPFLLAGPTSANNRSAFDIAVEQIDGADPCPYYYPVTPYLNSASVQQDMGVPLNFTVGSNVVLAQYSLDLFNNPFNGTGDAARRSMSDLEYVIQNGAKVAMVYGDRDYRCNWMGGESVALALQHKGRQQFLQSGYQDIISNATYKGGVVKQAGKLSFSRVFQAGHAVSAYQPETVYRIFIRSMFDRDVATGDQNINGRNYSSVGPQSSLGIREVLPVVPPTCMVEGEFQDVSVWALLFS